MTEKAAQNAWRMPSVWINFFRMRISFFHKEIPNAGTKLIGFNVLGMTLADVFVRSLDLILHPSPAPSLIPGLRAVFENAGIPLVFYPLAFLALNPIQFFLFSGVYWFTARILGSNAQFKSQAYIFSLISVPFTILAGTLYLAGAVPALSQAAGILQNVLAIYFLIVSTRGMMAIHEFNAGKAVLPTALLALLVLVGLIFLASYLISG